MIEHDVKELHFSFIAISKFDWKINQISIFRRQAYAIKNVKI